MINNMYYIFVSSSLCNESHNLGSKAIVLDHKHSTCSQNRNSLENIHVDEYVAQSGQRISVRHL